MAHTVRPTTGVVAEHPAVPDAVTLLAYGEFDADNSDEIATAVQDALAAGRHAITVDLQHVGFISAATVRTLLTCRAVAVADGGSLRVVNAGGIVARVLDLTVSQDDLRPAGRR